MSEKSFQQQLEALPEPLFDFGNQVELLKRMVILAIQSAQEKGNLEAEFKRGEKIAARIEKALSRERHTTKGDLLLGIAYLISSTVEDFIEKYPENAKKIYEAIPIKKDKVA